MRRIRDLPNGDMRVYLQIEVRRVDCRSCQAVKGERLDFLSANPFYTERFAHYVGRRCRASTIKDVAKELNLDWHTVKELDKHYMREQLRRVGAPGPKIIGIDELSIKKRHQYRIVVSDLIRERPIWFGGTDRSEASMDEFYQFLGEKRAKRIRLAVMDMWKPFRNSTTQNAPQAAILFNKFHVLRHLGEALDKVRKAEYHRLTGKHRRSPGAPPPGGRAPPPPPLRIRAAPARPEIAPTSGTARPAPSVGLPLPGATAARAQPQPPPAGNQRPHNFNLPPPAARSGAAGAARGAATERAGESRPATRGIAASEAKAAGAATAFFGQPALGRRVAFILDMSGSMMGGRWETCVRELAAALQALSADREFLVVLFSDRLVEPPGQLGWMSAHKDIVAGVMAWMQAISPAGGTVPAPAFERVYGLPARPDALYFLTDGEFYDCTPAAIARLNTSGSLPRLGAAALDIGRSLFGKGKDSPPAVIHTIALDDASSAAALRQIAQDSGGEFTHASSQ